MTSLQTATVILIQSVECLPFRYQSNGCAVGQQASKQASKELSNFEKLPANFRVAPKSIRERGGPATD